MSCRWCGAFCSEPGNTCDCARRHGSARDRDLVREGLLIGLDSIIPAADRAVRIDKIIDDCITEVDRRLRDSRRDSGRNTGRKRVSSSGVDGT